MPEDSGSISDWLAHLRAGDEHALQPLWDRYFSRLVERARAKLCALHSPLAVNDGEDIALSAFHALYQGITQGRFPRLDDRDDLWRVLVHLAAGKARDRHRDECRQKRGGGKVIREVDLLNGFDQDQGKSLDQIIDREPSPELAAIVAEEYRGWLEALDDPSVRLIAERKLACFTNAEIARELGVSLRTVTLKLELIRKTWKENRERS